MTSEVFEGAPTEQIRLLDPFYTKEKFGIKIFRQHIARYNFILTIIKGTVIDLGCGTGFGTFFLSFFADEILGIDSSEEAIGEAIALFSRPNLEFVVYDLDKEFLSSFLPLLDGEQLDALVGFEILEHLEDPAKLLSQVREVLKPSGIALFSLPCMAPSEYHKQVYPNMSSMVELILPHFSSVDILAQFDTVIIPFSVCTEEDRPHCILFMCKI